jgi:hypothetical protein
MKTLEEKKLLVKMAKAFGQPVDSALIESIEREEKLAAALFNEQKEIVGYKEGTTFLNRVPILKEDLITEAEPAPKPAETNLQPPEEYKVQQVANYLDTVSNAKKPPLVAALQDNEFQALRKTVLDLLQKVNTLSWGGGGTGIVRLYDGDDFDRSSIEDDKQFVTWRNGYFQLDYINPNEIVANTVFVTSNSYQITNDDYYIGVNVASTVTITLPPSDEVYTGREFYVKDESGNAGAPARFIDIYPSGSDKIDNQNYVRLQIDNGGLKFIYRNGWRVI